MAAALVCAMIGSLSLSPDRSQFFSMDEFSVSCPVDGGPWSVYRNTTYRPSPQACALPWGTPREQSCVMDELRHTDSGWYWCQSQDCKTPAVNITIPESTVILEIPLFPVTEGQSVTLNCSYKEKEHHKPTSDFEAVFFKDRVFLGRFPGGRMVLSSVSKTDHEGFYNCEHPSTVQSEESRLIVQSEERISTVAPSPPSKPREIPLYRVLCFTFLFLLYTTILCIGLCIYCKLTRAQAEEKKLESERVSLRRVRNS